MAEALTLVVDVATGEAVTSLRAAGIRPLLLKGRSFAGWLYDADEKRPSTDADLLVRRDDRDAAGVVLAGLGYREYEEHEPPVDLHPHAQAWVRDGGAAIDLHWTLPGVQVDEDRAWEVLTRDTETIDVRGVACEVLATPARLVHVCLHAAQHAGGTPRTIEDLNRAIDRAPWEQWLAAIATARSLGAVSAFAAGLQLTPSGERVMKGLTLDPVVAPDIYLRRSNLSEGGLRVALLWQILKSARSSERPRLLWRSLFPSRAYMREWVASQGRSDSRLGLYAAYVIRLARNIAGAGQAARALRRVRATQELARRGDRDPRG
jgi:putative nucleotidyltransferase-like protein